MTSSPSVVWGIVSYNPDNFKIIMANVETISLGSAVRSIPRFEGGSESDLKSFEQKCEFLLKNVTYVNKPKILKGILSELKGRAFDAVRYREINSWEELKKHFRTIFGASHSATFLQNQLNSIKQNKNESITDCSGRIEKAYNELTHVSTLNKTAEEAAIIAKTIQGHALNVFILGVSYSI